MVKIIALFHIFYKTKNKTVNKFSYSTYSIQNKNFNFRNRNNSIQIFFLIHFTLHVRSPHFPFF